jgi:hypothetical protein
LKRIISKKDLIVLREGCWGGSEQKDEGERMKDGRANPRLSWIGSSSSNFARGYPAV